jgi:multicomponent Na+:H+ antiporter subunit G
MFAAADPRAARDRCPGAGARGAGPRRYSIALQAANTIGTCAMLLLAVMGFLTGRPEFLDLALTYGLLNAIGTIAVLKFLRQGDLGEPTRGANREPAVDDPELGLPAGRWAFCLIGGIGLLRMPDFYTRMHAASVTETLGAGLILLGLMLQAGWTLVAVKLLMIGLLVFFVSPTASHALARAALLRGLKPLCSRTRESPIETLIIDVLLVMMALVVLVLARCATCSR